MELLIGKTGAARCIYGEEIDLRELGRLKIQRGSHVEPTEDGSWIADLAPVNGPVLGPFTQRSAALEAESVWLLRYWLPPQRHPNGDGISNRSHSECLKSRIS